MNMEEVLERDLTIAKEDYERQKKYFLFTVNKEIDRSCFETNTISLLAAMLETKTKIKTIEETIQRMKMKRMSENGN